MKKKLLLVLLFLCLITSLWAKNSKLYSSGDLTCNLTTDIVQDSRGFIWIATEYGLNKFDGMHFVQYLHSEKNKKSLGGNYIRCLFQDSKKNLWIGLSNGLQRYLPESDSFQSITFEDGLTPFITKISEMSNGEIWITTGGRGVFVLSPDHTKAIRLHKVTDASSHSVTAIFEDNKKQVWIGTDAKGLFCFDLGTKKIKRKYNTPELVRSKITDIAQDRHGNLHISNIAGVLVLDQKTNQFSPIPYSGDQKLTITDMLLARDGKLLVATDGQGLKYFDPVSASLQDFKSSYNMYDFSAAKIVKILQDKDSNLWLGCYFSGALMLPNNEATKFSFWNFKKESTKITGGVISICKDHEGFVWVCVDNEGIYKFDREGKIIATFPQLKTAKVLFEDSQRTLWIGTFEGVGKLNKNSGTISYVKDLANKPVKAFAEDKSLNLYIAVSREGFYKLNLKTGKMRLYSSFDKNSLTGTFTNNWISTMVCDKDGLLWLGHYKGVDCYNTHNGRFIKWPISKALEKNICLSLLADQKNNIWIGTNKGLYVFNKKKQSIRKYNQDNGLSNNVISGLALDRQGDIWCSTYDGINHIKLLEGKIIKFYSGNGLRDNFYTNEAYFTDKQGMVYFGSNYGITSFLPENVTQVNYDKQVVISGFYINGISVNQTTSSNEKPIIDTALPNASKFVLSSWDNSFTVEFTTMDYVNQENIYYEYRLSNLSKVWYSTLPGESRTTYNYLSPGTYLLEVRASKNGSFTPIKRYEITVLAPWYASGFAYFIYLLILCGLLTAVLLHLRRKQNAKINQEKLQTFINISHEIRSPMTMIISPIEKLLKQDFEPGTKATLLTIHKNANRILRLVNQLLDIRKFDNGQLQLKCAETNLSGYIWEVLQEFENEAKNRNIKLLLETSPDPIPVWIDRNNFDKILHNLLSNSFKFTPDNGEIKIMLSAGKSNNVANHYAEIKIMDSGIGMDKNKVDKIFDLFYQMENDMSLSAIGTGIGLNLCKILVTMHHGTISAGNRSDGPGSCFTIRIPLGKEHLQKHEIMDAQVVKPAKIQNFDYSGIIADRNKTVRRKTNFKVLVVDDDAYLREYLQRELGDTYKIILSSNGEEALKTIYSDMPDLVISDVVMPKMDGIDLLKKIKTNSNLSHIPVILLTSKIEYQHRISALEIGADAYMAKPFTTDELLVQINNLISSRSVLKGKYSGAQDQADKIKTVEFKSSNEILMERVMNFVNSNLSNTELNVEMLAQSVGLSRVQLHRKLKEMTGLPTAEFIRNLKLKQAAALLADKKMNITQIAYAVGFTNQTHFSTAFKKFYGFSPTEYIENLEGKHRDNTST